MVRIAGGHGLVLTTDFFTPVVDDAYTFGRIAAANALSDVYAMGGTPVVAVNLLGWPRDVLPAELAAEVLRGGLEVAQEAGCHVGGGHSIDDPEPKYGMAVTGVVDVDAGDAQRRRRGRRRPLADQAARRRGAQQPAQGHRRGRSHEAVAVDDGAEPGGLAAPRWPPGIRAATDVTGFGLLGHLYKMARASGVTAVVDAAAVPYLAGAREALAGRDSSPAAPGATSTGSARTPTSPPSPRTRRCCWPTRRPPAACCSAGEIPGAPVIGEFVPRGEQLSSCGDVAPSGGPEGPPRCDRWRSTGAGRHLAAVRPGGSRS